MEKIKGHDDLCRIWSGDYRIIYRVDDEHRTVVIEAMGHRRDIYRGL